MAMTLTSRTQVMTAADLEVATAVQKILAAGNDPSMPPRGSRSCTPNQSSSGGTPVTLASASPYILPSCTSCPWPLLCNISGGNSSRPVEARETTARGLKSLPKMDKCFVYLCRKKSNIWLFVNSGFAGGDYFGSFVHWAPL